MMKVGRNDPCPCGSKKKYKQCCLPGIPGQYASPAVMNNHAKPAAADIYKVIGNGIEQHQAGNLLEAEAIYREVLSVQPDNNNVLNLLGIIAYQLERYAEAAHFFGQAISCNPSIPSTYFSLGNVFQAQGKADEAAACFHKAIALKPDYAEAHNNLGVAYKDQNRLEKAIACYEKAIIFNPAFVEAHSNLGNAFKDQGRQEEAIACFKTAILLNPDYAEAHFNQGVVLMDQGKWDESMACYLDAILLKPDFAEAHCNLGMIFMEQGRLDEALASCQKALSFKPDFVAAYNNMGAVLRMQGKLGAALACYQKVIRLEPGNRIAPHLIATLNGHNPERASSQYIEKLFDGHADEFDTHLVGDLKYETPEKLAALIGQFLLTPSNNLDILDLGCGTGLAGAAISSYARQLVGVDLSARMLGKAQARNLYQRLVRADLLGMMQNEMAGSYDLIIAADVFVYLGKLDAIINEARRLLRPGGFLAFSVKSLESISREETGQRIQMDYQLNSTGRYAHSAAYLSRLAAANGFQNHKMIQAQARLEMGHPVHAWLALWGS